MAKYLIGLLVAGAVAVYVKGTADDVAKKLLVVRPPEAPKAAPEPAPEPAAFADPLGHFRVTAPGNLEPAGIDGSHLHGIGRGFRCWIKDRSLELRVNVEFLGSDDPNDARQTLAWYARREAGSVTGGAGAHKVRFTSLAGGAEMAGYRTDPGGPHSVGRFKIVLVKKWVYTAQAYGPRFQVDADDVTEFLDSFAVTDAALAHEDGGAWK